MPLNPQAETLNETIRQENPTVFDLLSRKGRAVFFPKKGIISQTAEAKSAAINATIGAALEDDGTPMALNCIGKYVDLDKKELFPYAPPFGKPEIRELWRSLLEQKNPSLAKHPVGTPVVTSALTHGLSLAGYLFVDEGDEMILPDLYWGNYRLIFANGYGARIVTYPMFTESGSFNVDGLAATLQQSGSKKKIVVLNFPNNPTGYTITREEADRLLGVLTASAEAGNAICVLVDDAYFGLVYREGIIDESIFCRLAAAHERILAVKLDGPTKEDYVWGFRVGFTTFGSKTGGKKMYEALEAKLAAIIRGNISNVSHPGQSLLLHAFRSPDYAREKKEKYAILKNRFDRIEEIL